jgi:hypothetical protein
MIVFWCCNDYENPRMPERICTVYSTMKGGIDRLKLLPLRVLDLVGRYHATADALDECGRLLCTLKVHR